MDIQSVFNQNAEGLEHHQPEFFESLWIKVTGPLKEKVLINLAYSSNVNLPKLFLDELISEITIFYSSTDNLIMFGDYNINVPEETGKQLLNNFIAHNGLLYANSKKAAWRNEKKFSLIDHCFISRNQLSQYLKMIISLLYTNHH